MLINHPQRLLILAFSRNQKTFIHPQKPLRSIMMIWKTTSRLLYHHQAPEGERYFVLSWWRPPWCCISYVEAAPPRASPAIRPHVETTDALCFRPHNQPTHRTSVNSTSSTRKKLQLEAKSQRRIYDVCYGR